MYFLVNLSLDDSGSWRDIQHEQFVLLVDVSISQLALWICLSVFMIFGCLLLELNEFNCFS